MAVNVMVKVYAGPIVSDITGSIGPVTYFSTLGRLVARARVRPNQHLTSKRIASRNQWKLLMRWWAIFRPYTKSSWNRFSFPAMHGVNRFIQLNRPALPSLSYAYPPDPNVYPPINWGRRAAFGGWELWVWGDWSTWPLAKAAVGLHRYTVDGYTHDWFVSKPDPLIMYDWTNALSDFVFVGYSPDSRYSHREFDCQVQGSTVENLPIIIDQPPH